MSFSAIAAQVEGGMATVTAALANPRVRELAAAQGVNLEDAAQVESLLATASKAMASQKASIRPTSSSVGPSRVQLSTGASPGANLGHLSFAAQQAIRTYQALASM